MDSFELNKIAGAVLGTCLFAMGLGILADGIFHVPPPAKPGYLIEVAEAKPHGDTPGGAPAATAPPIAVRFASADPARGADQFKKCSTCHTADKGGAVRQGPPLWGIVDRKAGSFPGFKFSASMAAHGPWTYEDLDKFIENPKGHVPGTIMNFPGIKDPGQRADLVAYLRTLADTPAPPPAAPATQ